MKKTIICCLVAYNWHGLICSINFSGLWLQPVEQNKVVADVMWKLDDTRGTIRPAVLSHSLKECRGRQPTLFKLKGKATLDVTDLDLY